MFWIKDKTIVLDSFVTEEWVLNYNPIQKASRFIPQWYKEQDNYHKDGLVDQETMKQCPAILSLLNTGFVIPLWSDFIFDINTEHKQIRWDFADKVDVIQETAISHPVDQWKDYADPTKYFQLKLISPWLFKTKEDIKFYWSSSYFNNELSLPYSIMSAIVDFKYQSGTHVNMIIDLNRAKQGFKIDATKPLVHLIPLTERKVEVKNHIVSTEEYRQIQNGYKKVFFTNNYKKIKKCPFHKG